MKIFMTHHLKKIRKLKFNLQRYFKCIFIRIKIWNDLFLSKSEAKDFFYNFQNRFRKFDFNKIIFIKKN